MLNTNKIHNVDDLIQQLFNGKGTFFELNMLRSFGPSCLNRDENGDAKSIYIGGDKRIVVSSQCLRFPIRLDLLEKLTHRSRYLPCLIAEYLNSKYEITEEYKENVKKLAHCLFSQSKPKKKTEEVKISEEDVEKNCILSTLMFVGKSDIVRIAEAIYKAYPTTESFDIEFKDSKKKSERKYVVKSREIYDKLFKKLYNEKNNSLLDPDTGCWGRLSTCGILDTVDSAIWFNFGYSVNKATNDSDFFTAQDTFVKATDFFSEASDSIGSGHLNVRDISSNTYYVYMGISLVTVVENAFKGFDFENNKDGIIPRLNEWFSYVYDLIEDCIMLVPTTMQHQMASFPVPAVYATLKQDSQNRTYDEAFEHEISATDEHSIMENAVIALNEAIVDDPFETGEIIKKYWISKKKYSKYIDDSIPKVTLKEMLDDFKGYIDEITTNKI